MCLFLPPFPFPDTLFCPPALAVQAYPSGLPDEQLKLLGSLSRLYTPEEISRWWVTSSDTLSALLNPMYGKWGDAQVNPWQQRGTGAGDSEPGRLGAQAQLGAEVSPVGSMEGLQHSDFYPEHLPSRATM